MRKNTLIRIGGLIFLPSFVIAMTWMGFELFYGKESVDRWIDDLPDRVFWPLAILLFGGLLGALLVWWVDRRKKD